MEIEIDRYIDMLSTLKEGYHCCPYLFPKCRIKYFQIYRKFQVYKKRKNTKLNDTKATEIIYNLQNRTLGAGC